LLSVVEDGPDVLLRLADVLTHHAREVDLVEVEPQLARDDVGRHCLAGTRLAGEERVEPASKRQPPRKTPVTVDAGSLPHRVDHLSQLRQGVVRQHDVRPGEMRFDLGRQGAQLLVGMGATGGK
jgi:hypothetical protein